MGDKSASESENPPGSREANIAPIDSVPERNSASLHSEKKDGDAVVDVPKTADDEEKGGFGAYLVSAVLWFYETRIIFAK